MNPVGGFYTKHAYTSIKSDLVEPVYGLIGAGFIAICIHFFFCNKIHCPIQETNIFQSLAAKSDGIKREITRKASN